jgi:hypothetical protein
MTNVGGRGCAALEGVGGADDVQRRARELCHLLPDRRI